MELNVLNRRTLLSVAAAQGLICSRQSWAGIAATTRLVVPLPYSGGAIRLAVHRLSETLGQSSVIEEKFGANGLIATRYVAQHPSQHPIFLVSTNSTSTLNFISYSQLLSERRQMFKAAGLLLYQPMVLIASTRAPANLQEFVDYGIKHPGKLNYASPGLGSLPHMAALLLKDRVGVSGVHIPQNSPSIVQVMGGHVDYSFVTLSAVLPYMGTGRFNILAVASNERLDQMADIPLLDSIAPGLHIQVNLSLLASKRLADDHVAAMNQSINQLNSNPSWVQEITAQGGIIPKPHSMEACERILDQELVMWRGLLKKLNINDLSAA